MQLYDREDPAAAGVGCIVGVLTGLALWAVAVGAVWWLAVRVGLSVG